MSQLAPKAPAGEAATTRTPLPVFGDVNFYLSAGMGLLFLLWATYNRGLLFAFDQRFGALPLLLVSALVIWRHGLPFSGRQPAVVALMIYLAGNIVSLPFMVTPVEAVPGFIYYAVVTGFCFVLGALASRSPRSLVGFSAVLAIAAGTASWFGFLAMVKVVEMPDAYAGRLASSLQYANAYAVLAVMGVLASVGVSSPQRSMTWRHVTLFACFLGLFLSASRGGLLVAAICLAGYAVVTFWRLPQYAVILAIHGGIAAYAYARIGPLIGVAEARTVLLIILTATAIAAGLGWATEAGFRTVGMSRRTTYVVASVFAVGALIAMNMYGSFLLTRLSTLFEIGATSTLNVSDLSRVQHLKDAARIVLDRPLGSGTRGWWALYPQYQPFRYVINVAHSHWAETAVAAGVLGVLGLVALWIILARNYVRKMLLPGVSPSWHAAFWSLAALGVHSSVIDADMNFLMFSFIAFFGFGLMHGAAQEMPLADRSTRRTRVGFALLALLFTVPIVTFLIGDILSNRAMTHAISGKPNEAERLLRTARLLNPTQPILHINSAKLASQAAVGPKADMYLEQARAHMAKAVAVDPYRSDFRVDLAAILSELGELKLARAELEKAISLAPWQVRYWEKLLEFEIESAQAFRAAGDAAGYREHLAAANEVLRQIDKQDASRPQLAGALGLEMDSPRLTELKAQLAKL